MLTLVAAIAITASARQNPFPPDVTIPKDWHVGYWESSKFKRGALISPDGLEIGFPDYTPTGMVAMTQYEMSSYTSYFVAVVERTVVNVSLSRDGLLAVSFPSEPSQGYVARTFDFWSVPRGARQAALALMIPLTWLDKHHAAPDDSSALKYRLQPTPDRPFSLLAVTSERGREETSSSWIKLKSSTATLAVGSPAKPKWTESTPLLGGKLQVAEDSTGKIWVTVSRPEKKDVVITSLGHEPKDVVLATLAALVYPPPG